MHDNGEEIKKMERNIQNMLVNEEIYWKQRSRADWLKKGDKNTKFFHHNTSSRKQKNKILGIDDATGRWTEREEDVENEFCNYFTKLFTTSSPNQNQIAAVLAGLTWRV